MAVYCALQVCFDRSFVMDADKELPLVKAPRKGRRKKHPRKRNFSEKKQGKKRRR